MTLKILTEQHLQFLSLKGGCTDSSKSILVKVAHCWKSHVAAHLMPYWATTWENQQCGPASQEDSDKPRHQLSLIRVLAVHMKKVLVLCYWLSAQWRLWVQWLSGRVLDSRPRDRGFEPQRRHSVVSLSKTHDSLLSTGSAQKDPSRHNWKIVDWGIKNQIKLK